MLYAITPFEGGHNRQNDEAVRTLSVSVIALKSDPQFVAT